MPLVKFEIPGGIIADVSDYSAGPVWKNGERVRFQQGQPEPIGGFEKLASYDALGTPSNVKIWRDFSNNDLMAIGTEKRLNLVKNGTIYDITPVTTTVLNTITFDTANESTAVNVNHTSHPATIGDYVVITNAAAGGGITVGGTYEVKTVVGANDYTITHSAAATSTTSGVGGGATDIDYLLATGSAIPTAGLGWGADTWGTGTWGTARDESNITLEPALWSFDLWGEDLIACKRGGKIYEWDASAGTSTRAVAVTNAPTSNLFIMVSIPDRHLVSFGAHDGSSDDRLNIRWTDQENRTTWTASATNTAGSQRLQFGDNLIAAIQTKEQILLWTNGAMFGQVFSGPPFTFTFRPLSIGCEPVGQNAVAEQNSLTFWFGCNNFHVFTGREEVLPSPVRDKIFDDYNPDLEFLVYAGLNKSFSEVWWLYPSSSATTTPDKYVTYNWMTKEWAYGAFDRCVWIDATSWVSNPIAYDSSGVFYHHEKGKNANGSALSWSIETGVFEIPEAGDDLFFINRLIPDVSQQTGAITLTLYYRKYPTATESNKTATVTSSTEKINKRIRGRQMRLKWSSTEVESFAKIGNLRADVRLDGKR
jgi:hypothetical protein